MQDVVPTTRKKFDRWLEPRREFMPADLYAKGERVRCSMHTRGQKAWKQSRALRQAGMRDWHEFTTDPRLPQFVEAYLL